MKLYPDSKVYILCHGNVQTGGPESLHQLASALISFGVETYMIYTVMIDGVFNPEDPVHDAYKKYHVPYTNQLKDHSKNVIIIPETITCELYGRKKIRRVLWWMSVNNYLGNIVYIAQYYMENTFMAPIPQLFTFHDADKNIEHWAKSEYSRLFLELNGVPANKIHHVESYMNQVFFKSAAKINLADKKNLVAYNPKKGFKITRQLIATAPDIDWRPIQNMTSEQVQNLLAEAKVYIDFGEFPGLDRLPREAAICRCVVIVGKRGAAANDVDINIPAEFKFDMDATLNQIIDKIREVFENFERELDKQKAFRDKELNAQKNFIAEIVDVFKIKNFPPPSVAFVQGVQEKSFLLVQELFQSKDLMPKFIVDDVLATAEISDELILRKQNRNYLRVGENFIEIITRDDAKFLYLEGRIKKFALLEPTDAELDEVKNFYEPNYEDVLIFNR